MQKYSSVCLALILGTTIGLSTAALADPAPVTPSSSVSSEGTPDLPDYRVMDVMRTLSDSLAVQDIQKQLEKKSAEYQKEFATQDQKFRGENEKLVASQHTLKPEELQKKQMDLQQRFEKFQEKVDMRRRQLELAYRQSLMKVHEKINDLLKQIGLEKKLSRIYRDPSLAWIRDAEKLDITTEVVTQLNKQMPKIAVKIPTEKEVAASPLQQLPLPHTNEGGAAPAA